MTAKINANQREMLQSANLNFLIGAGLSTPYLPLLGDIETRLTAEPDESSRIPIYKEYFEKVMVPNLRVIQGNIPAGEKSKCDEVHKNYKTFFELLSKILLRRKSTILSKQANIFTTNIDIFMETALEESNIDYNDGFSGRMRPVFSLSNFKKSVFKRSLHFENVSEIPMFNLVKMHGSLTWQKESDQIFLSKLQHFDEALLQKNGTDFLDDYEKIAVINPEPKKLKESVIDLIYYELLRMYSSELEKENTILFIMGCSMNDEHIREITLRSADSNPTLKIFVFCYSKAKVSEMETKMRIGKLKYSNIEIIAPEDDEPANKFSFEKIQSFLEQILSFHKKETNGHEDDE